MRVTFSDKIWEGENIPEIHRCETPGAMSPGLIVSDIPTEANFLIMEYNDRDYEPLSKNGGHGTLAYRFEAGTSEVSVPPTPELELDNLPDGVEIVRHNLGQTKRGYRAPCGGLDHFNVYEVIVYAVNFGDQDTILAELNLTLGKLK